MVLRGCLLSLGLLAGLVVGYAYWFLQHFDRTPSLVFGAVVGFIVFLCLASINNARASWRDWRLLSLGARDVQLIDGALVAACGTIHPLDAPLTAPFSGQPCLICEYDLARADGTTKADTGGSDYVGFLMTPSFVRTALGEVRVLGFPALEQISERRCRGYAAAWNARSFLATHDFEDHTGLKLVTAVGAFDEVWRDGDGRVDKNIQLGRVTIDDLFPPETIDGLERLAEWEKTQKHANNEFDTDADENEESEDEETDEEADSKSDAIRPPNLRLPKLLETRIAPGERVCVIGVYNAERGGLLPPPIKGPYNRLLRGKAEELAAVQRSKIARQLIGGTIGLLSVHAVILIVITSRG